MIKIIRNNYFMSEVLTSCIDKSDACVHCVNEFTDGAPLRKRRTIFDKLFLERVFPAFVIIILSVKRIVFGCKGSKKYSSVLYFAIDDFSTLSKLMRGNFDVNKHVVWLWNPCFSLGCNELDIRVKIWALKLFGVKIYTFDINDSLKYKLCYHKQLYSSKLVSSRLSNNDSTSFERHKVFFTGVEKGRLNVLQKMECVFNKIGLKPNFYVLGEQASFERNNDSSICFIDENMNYDAYLDHVSKSEYLLEIVQDGQSGLTLRTLESIFFQKKLITTNQHIVNTGLYNPNNILVIDITSSTFINELKIFTKKEFSPYSKDLLAEYDISNFLQLISN